MSDVGGEGIDFSLFAVECERKELFLGDPVITIESLLEIGGLPLKPGGCIGITPKITCQPRRPALCVINISLDFARSQGRRCDAAVGKPDGIPRVFPALILYSVFFVASLIL